MGKFMWQQTILIAVLKTVRSYRATPVPLRKITQKNNSKNNSKSNSKNKNKRKSPDSEDSEIEDDIVEDEALSDITYSDDSYEEDFRKYSCAKIIFSLWNFFVVDLFPSWL